ncbi:MAG: sugar ABC transporter permease [Candidatus Planktophila sp.]
MSVTIGSGHEGNVRQQIDAYVARVKGGEMGALPSVLSLFFLTILFSVLNPYFLTQGNFANLLTQTATLMMLAMALVFVILLAEIDLSAGVTSGVAMALFILMTNKGGIDWRVSILAGLICGIIIGAIIGFFVAKVGVPSFVVTLGLFLGFQGLQLALLGDGGLYRIEVPEIKAIMNDNLPAWMGWGFFAIALATMTALNFYDRAVRTRSGLANRPISLMYTKLAIVGVLGAALVAMLNLNRSTSMKEISGVPIVVPIAITVLFMGTLLLDRTLFGRHLYAVGGNPEAARRSGIKVVKVRIIAFMLCSFLAVISGIFNASRIGAVEATAGKSIVLSGVAAAVVGGVSLFGGRGRLIHAAVGALVIAIIDNGLGLLGLPAGINFLVTGGVLILAATVDAVSRKRSSTAR